MSGPALNARFGADISELKAKMSEATGLVDKYGKGLKDIAGTLGLAFGVQQVSSFALEITKLAGQADGVRQAFDKIQGSAYVLEQMKAATQGTVSNLELMKSAVQASNFNIPIEQLGTLFQFAYERAKATGQSVDYLVNSIVVGIGRKSPLILDNLGISAVQLKEKLGGVSTEAASIGQIAEAVGKIASEALNNTGTSAVTAAEKLARLDASWENLKENFGSGLADLIAGEDANDLLTNFNNQLIVWGDEHIGFWEKVLGSAQDYADLVKEIEMRQKKAAAAAAFTSTKDLTGILATSKGGDPLMDQMNKALAGPKAAGKMPMGASIDASGEMATLATGAANYIEGLKQSALELEGAVIGPLSEVAEFSQDIQQGQTDFEKAQYQERLDAFMVAEEIKREQVEMTGKAIGASFGLAAAGVMSFEQALRQSTASVLSMMADRALAGLYAGIMQNPAIPFPLNVGLVAAGKAFVSSLFAGLGASGGRGGGGGGGGYSTERIRNNSSLFSENAQTINGQVKIDGTQLLILFGRQSSFNGYTQPAFAPIGG